MCRYPTNPDLVVHFPGLEVVRGTVEDDRGQIRERIREEMTDLYERALASTVMPTVNEAVSSAPAVLDAKVAVIGYRHLSLLRRRRNTLSAIYAATLPRSVLDIDWASQEPTSVALAADDVLINTDRRGALKPLGKLAGDDIHALRIRLEESST